MTKPNPHEQSMLCVGGPLDGERHTADRRQKEVRLYVPAPRPLSSVKVAVYSITSFSCQEAPSYELQQLFFLRPYGTSSLEGLRMLIEGYHKP